MPTTARYKLVWILSDETYFFLLKGHKFSRTLFTEAMICSSHAMRHDATKGSSSLHVAAEAAGDIGESCLHNMTGVTCCEPLSHKSFKLDGASLGTNKPDETVILLVLVRGTSFTSIRNLMMF